MELPLRGIIPPVATPLINDSELDEPGTESLINHLLNGGVHGLFLLGTTGEGTSLSYQLRAAFVKKVCELTGKKVPVLVGITDTSFGNSLEMAAAYKEAGADLLVVAPPYYNPLSQEEMQQYLADLSPQLPLPYILYNIPSHTKLHMSLETVKHARDLGAVGIKDSSGNRLHLLSLVKAFADSTAFSVLTGIEDFIAETIRNGGHGAVAGGANLFPKFYVELYEAALNGDNEKIQSLQKIILKINNTLYKVGKSPSGIILGIKTALSVLGICSGYIAHPLRSPEGEDYEEIRRIVLELKQDPNIQSFTETK
jgi:2-dehydro-3-deoxy-D-pentonate aldolase